MKIAIRKGYKCIETMVAHLFSLDARFAEEAGGGGRTSLMSANSEGGNERSEAS